MRKGMLLALTLSLALSLACPALAAEQEQSPAKNMKQTQDTMKPSQMSNEGPPTPYGSVGKYEGDFKRRGNCPGSYHGNRGMNRYHRDMEVYRGMSDKDKKAYRQASAKFLMETLDLRKELAAKKVELNTLWAQPKPDQDKISEISDDVADLRAKLEKKRNQFTMQCRNDYGDRGWSCPGYGSDENDWWPFW